MVHERSEIIIYWERFPDTAIRLRIGKLRMAPNPYTSDDKGLEPTRKE